MRGKLVPQDPSDEPASVLLERIADEKARLVKEGKIKKIKALPEIREEEKLFELPEEWQLSRLQDLTSYIQRGKGPDYADVGTVKVISQKCIQWSGFDASQARFISDSSIKGYQDERFLQLNDLLWNSTGTGTVGRINVLDNLPAEKIVADSHVTVIRPLEMDCNFLWCYIAAPGIQSRIEPGHEKSLVSGSTKQVELSTSAVSTLVIPIPPLSEQHRIIAKVDELMALCDQLEQHSESQLAAHQTLVETLLSTLTDSADADELAQNWARLSTHFDTLFTTEASIQALKQTILQLAVTGTLVSWGDNVREEKLKNCISFGPRNGFSPKETTEDTGFYVLKLGATSYGSLNLTEIKNIDVAIEKESHLFIRKDDILIQRGNSANYVGSNCLVECDVDGIIYPDLMMKITVNHKVSAKYMSLWLSSPKARRFMWDRMTGTSGTMPKISKKVVEEIPVMVPLMACQNDIVAKVDALMSLCDQLKSRLQTSQQTQLALAESLVEGALA